jgi:hypothetical protein
MTDCDSALSFGYITQMILEDQVDAILGPPCITCSINYLKFNLKMCYFLAALIAGYGAAFYNTPMYVWGASIATELSNASLYTSLSNINVNTNK